MIVARLWHLAAHHSEANAVSSCIRIELKWMRKGSVELLCEWMSFYSTHKMTYTRSCLLGKCLHALHNQENEIGTHKYTPVDLALGVNVFTKKRIRDVERSMTVTTFIKLQCVLNSSRCVLNRKVEFRHIFFSQISAKEQAKENTFALMWLGIPILVVLSVGAMYTCFAW